MKRARQIVIGILASLALGLSGVSAHAHPGGAAGMGPGAMAAGEPHEQARAAGAHHGRMAQMHQQGQRAEQHRAMAGATGDCPMGAQQGNHSH